VVSFMKLTTTFHACMQLLIRSTAGCNYGFLTRGGRARAPRGGGGGGHARDAWRAADGRDQSLAEQSARAPLAWAQPRVLQPFGASCTLTNA
jgi:hypothetical protein